MFSVPYSEEGEFPEFSLMLQILVGPVAHVRNCSPYWELAGQGEERDGIASLKELQYEIEWI